MSGKLFIFLFMTYLVIMFLNATFTYQSAETEAGQAYTTGTATFANGSAIVEGSGTTWVEGMSGGYIRLDADELWCKILTITDADTLVLADVYTGTGGSGAYTMAVAGGWGGYTLTSTLSYLMDYKNAVQQLPVLGGIPMPVPNAEYFAAWRDVILLQVGFLDQPGYEIVQWFLNGFAVVGMLSMVLLFVGIVRGNVTWG